MIRYYEFFKEFGKEKKSEGENARTPSELISDELNAFEDKFQQPKYTTAKITSRDRPSQPRYITQRKGILVFRIPDIMITGPSNMLRRHITNVNFEEVRNNDERTGLVVPGSRAYLITTVNGVWPFISRELKESLNELGYRQLCKIKRYKK